MSSTLTATGTTSRHAPLSRANKIGLGLGILLGLFDLAGPLTTPHGSGSQAGPPMSVLVVDALIGLITVIGAVYAWRTGNRVGSRVVAGSRILSSISSLPAFFVSGVGAGLVVLASTGILITVLTCWLVLSRPAGSGELDR